MCRNTEPSPARRRDLNPNRYPSRSCHNTRSFARCPPKLRSIHCSPAPTVLASPAVPARYDRDTADTLAPLRVSISGRPAAVRRFRDLGKRAVYSQNTSRAAADIRRSAPRGSTGTAAPARHRLSCAHSTPHKPGYRLRVPLLCGEGRVDTCGCFCRARNCDCYGFLVYLSVFCSADSRETLFTGRVGTGRPHRGPA